MSKRADQDSVADSKEAILRIIAYTEDTSYEQFLEDKKTQDAVVRNLEIVGEAAKNISRELKDENPQIPWKDLAGRSIMNVVEDFRDIHISGQRSY